MTKKGKHMSEIVSIGSSSPFDRIKQVRADGSEFWSARKLQGLMGYSTWQHLSPVIARAQQAASNTGMSVTSNFTGSRKITATKPQEDFELSRKAAYLVAMNGDPNKPEVAAAQAYFADRTLQAEHAGVVLEKLPEWAQQQIATIMRVGKVEAEQAEQARQLREIAARVDSVEGNYGEFTALGYAKLNDLPTDRPWLSRLGKKASAILRETGQEPRKRQDATFGNINVYPTWALDDALAEIPDAP